MLPTKFQFIWQKGFRGEDFLDINQTETRIACGSHVLSPIKAIMPFLVRLAKGNVICPLSSVNFSHINLLL
jgi:hypothetical protein